MDAYPFVQEIQMYSYGHHCMRIAVVWLCIPLCKMYSFMAVLTFVQDVQFYGCVNLCSRGTVVWLCKPLYEKYSCMAV